MLKISKKMHDVLTQDYFYRKVKNFLLERTNHPKLIQVLSLNEYYYPIWDSTWEKTKEMDEYLSAVTLTYVLVCHCEELDPEIMLDKIFQQDDPGLAMKKFCSDHQYIKFAEFDL